MLHALSVGGAHADGAVQGRLVEDDGRWWELVSCL